MSDVSSSFLWLARRFGVEDAAVLSAMEAAAHSLPRSRAVGVEIDFDGASASQVDAIVGMKGRGFEQASWASWAESHRSGGGTDAGTSRTEVAALLNDVVCANVGASAPYSYAWLEADGSFEASHPPALICEANSDSQADALALPLTNELAQLLPETFEAVQRVPLANAATMVGWMPGRAGTSKAAIRLYWDASVLRGEDVVASELLSAWHVPDELVDIVRSAHRERLACAVSVNATASGWFFDGVEIAPQTRVDEEEWASFDNWCSERLPTALHRGFEMRSVFARWDEQDGEKPFPDYLLGASVSLPDGQHLEARARPSHLKLVRREQRLRIKVYGGIDFVSVSGD
jgi:hypothetical protein